MPADPGPLPGRVVVAGGRAVHVVEQPGPGPAVLMLGGCGVPYYAWDRVLTLLPDRRVLRMDRPGLATPWPGTLPTLQEEVETVADLLGDEAPAVLVAHSMAGLHAEAVARSYPERVSGLVLVDGSVDTDPSKPSAGAGRRWVRVAAGTRAALRLLPPARPLGSLSDRLVTSVQSSRLRLTTPRPSAQRLVYRHPDAVPSVLAEHAGYADQVFQLANLRRTRALRAGLPVQVLTAAGDGGASWVRAQAWLADQLGAQHTVLADARHLIMVDRPDAVADAIRRLRCATRP